MIDLTEYRNSTSEQTRIADLMSLLPGGLQSAVDIGARDGYLSRKLLERIPNVTALDLETPVVDDPRIRCVKGDASALEFADNEFDLVLCAEVLEHIPRPTLEQVCRELARVARRYVLIGVPYKQDTRVGRTTCQNCGQSNPPWGHVNQFDDDSLTALFPDLKPVRTSYVGTSDYGTNALSCRLMDLAGNPYGNYFQEERCIHCGGLIGQPSERSFVQKVLSKTAIVVRMAQKPFAARHGNWIHLLLQKPS